MNRVILQRQLRRGRFANSLALALLAALLLVLLVSVYTGLRHLHV